MSGVLRLRGFGGVALPWDAISFVPGLADDGLAASSIGDPRDAGFEPALLATWPARQQGLQSTCVAHAVVAAHDILQREAMLLQGTPDPHWPASSARFLHTLMGSVPCAQPPELALLGYRRPVQAETVLRDPGVCPLAAWPDPGPLDEQPSDEARAAATAMRSLAFGHVDTTQGTTANPPGLVRDIFVCLQARQPVVATFPAFNATGYITSTTNWDSSDVIRSGNVRDPRPGEKPVIGAGHAVCLLAFQADPTEPLGGWFVFRNSHGGAFATSPPYSSAPVPRVPASGYGTISARHVQSHAWEVLTYALPGSKSVWGGDIDLPPSPEA